MLELILWSNTDESGELGGIFAAFPPFCCYGVCVCDLVVYIQYRKIEVLKREEKGGRELVEVAMQK